MTRIPLEGGRATAAGAARSPSARVEVFPKRRRAGGGVGVAHVVERVARDRVAGAEAVGARVLAVLRSRGDDEQRGDACYHFCTFLAVLVFVMRSAALTPVSALIRVD
mgnify:CR=1 FL=1